MIQNYKQNNRPNFRSEKADHQMIDTNKNREQLSLTKGYTC